MIVFLVYILAQQLNQAGSAPLFDLLWVVLSRLCLHGGLLVPRTVLRGVEGGHPRGVCQAPRKVHAAQGPP